MTVFEDGLANIIGLTSIDLAINFTIHSCHGEHVGENRDMMINADTIEESFSGKSLLRIVSKWWLLSFKAANRFGSLSVSQKELELMPEIRKRLIYQGSVSSRSMEQDLTLQKVKWW